MAGAGDAHIPRSVKTFLLANTSICLKYHFDASFEQARPWSSRKVGEMDNIRIKRRIFAPSFLKIGQSFSKISSNPTDGVVITGASPPVFNTRRFRPPFSSWAS